MDHYSLDNTRQHEIQYPSSMPRLFAAWNALADADSARLGRPAAPDSLRVPDQVTLSRGVFSFDSTSEHFTKTKPDLLERFVSVESDAGMLSFARRFGPLALFAQKAKAATLRPDPKRFALLRKQSRVHRERVAWWRATQAQFKMVLTMAAHYREGTAPAPAAFDEAEALGIRPFRVPIGLHATDYNRLPAEARVDLAGVLTVFHTRTLARTCGVRPALTMELNAPLERHRFELVFHDDSSSWEGMSLIGALCVQLLAATAGVGFAVCSACGRPYVPRRQPALGRRKYCPSCGRRAAVRAAKAAYRARQREIRNGHPREK